MRGWQQSPRVNRRDFLSGIAAIAAARSEECRLLLTRSSPRGECAIPPGLPRLADIPLRVLENPQEAPVELFVLGASAGGVEQQLAALSLFPIDRPAVFAVRLQNAVRIAFALLPGPAPLVVEVGPVRWVYEEPR